jgi:4-hydroxybenzoate polyprenyltransferase
MNQNMDSAKHFYKLALSLLRPQTYILLCAHLLLGFGYSIVGSESTFTAAFKQNIFDISISLLLIGLWYIFSAGVNDYSDYEIDKINLPKNNERPLVIGLLSKNNLRQFLTFVLFILLLLAYILSLEALVYSLVVVGLSWAYSMKPLRISYRGVLAPLMLPLGYVCYPFLLGFDVAGRSASIKHWVLLAALYLGFVSRVMLKDFRDVKGDKKFGKMTFLLRRGALFVTTSALTTYLGSLSITLLFVCLVSFNVFILAYILLFGFITIKIFLKLMKVDVWSEQKKILPFLSRAESLQTVGLIVFVIYLTGEFTFLAYISGLILLGYAGLTSISSLND